jgi:hypothetical protein
MLLDLGFVELVKTTPRRGAVEHHYRATQRAWLDKSEWRQVPPSLRREVSEAVLTQIWKDTVAAADAGTLEQRDSAHLSRTPLVLDEPGWEELAELLDDLLERVLTIQTEAAARLSADGDQDGVDARVVVMHYEAAPD